jgi:hypothetical protein
VIIFWGLQNIWTLYTAVSLRSDDASIFLSTFSVGLLFAFVAFGAGIDLVAGACILWGANWARILWSVWCIFRIGMTITCFPPDKVSYTSVVVPLLFVLLLFHPKANAFFAPGA